MSHHEWDSKTETAIVDRAIRGLTSRRRFLGLAGVASAGAVLVACNAESSAPTSTAAPGTTMASSGNTDLDTAAFAAGIEVLAVQTYTAALDAATTGKLGAVPPAVATFVTTAKAQHQMALDEWNKVLAEAGKPEVTTPNAKLKPTVDAAFAKVTDVTGAAQLALTLEQTASATYQKAVPALKDKAAIQLAGALEIVDAEHVAVLLFVLGQYPVPDTFAKTDKAATA